MNEVKLINSGKILENNKTVGQCKVPFGEVAGGIIIMHVVVQPSLAKTKTGILYLYLHVELFSSNFKNSFLLAFNLSLFTKVDIRMPGCLKWICTCTSSDS